MAEDKRHGRGDVPSIRELLWPTLQVLRALGELSHADEISRSVADELRLSQNALRLRTTNGKYYAFNYNMGWVRTNLKKAGLVENPRRGMWMVTEMGRAIETEEAVHEACNRPWLPDDGGEEEDESVEAAGVGRLTSDTRVWLMAAGEGGSLWEDFKASGMATIGYADIGDLSKYSTQEHILSALEGTGEFDTRPKPTAKGMYDFANVMRIGDRIIARGGTREVLGLGRVASDYAYDAHRDDQRHTRRVNWTSCRQPVIIPADEPGMPTMTLIDYTRPSSRLDRILLLVDRVSGGQIEYTTADALKDLFMSEKRFRRIFAAFKLRKNLILQGPPGTGKTFAAHRLAWRMIRRKDYGPIEMVQFHQSYAYEDFVQGYRPTENGGFGLRDGVFYEFCERARKDEATPHVFIIDEINRGNMSRIFGELLMLIEADKRTEAYAATLTYGKPGHRFYVPDNVYILGLMNTADRSLAVVDYALRRRFAFEDLRPEFASNGFRRHLTARKVDSQTIAKIQRRMTKLNTTIREDGELGPGFEIGHSFFVPATEGDIAGDAKKWYLDIVNTQIVPLLREYWFDDLGKAGQVIKELLG